MRLALASLACLISLPAFGAPPQPAAPKPVAPRPAAPKKPLGVFKLGPVYFTPKLELKNAGVNTNLYNSQTGAIPDTSIVLSPSVSGALPVGRRLRLTGKGYLDFNYFHNYQSERSIDGAGEGRAEVDVGRFTLFGGGGGGQWKQRFSIDLDERLLRQEKWATTGFLLKVRRKISVTLSGTGRVYEYEPSQVSGTSVQRALDRNELTATAQLRYTLTSQTTLLASADAIEDRFLKQLVEPRITRSYRYLGGFEFGERAFINGKILAGFREIPSGQRTAPYRGPALSVSASLPLLRLGRFTGLADRDVFYSVGGAGIELVRNSYVSTTLRGEASFELPFRLIGIGFFGLQEAKYLLPYRSGNTFSPRVEHLWTSGGSILRRIGTTIRVGGTIAWERRVSTVPGSSYEGLRYGVQATVAP